MTFVNRGTALFLACTALLFVSSIRLPAQAVANAQVSGQITDATGSAVSGADIRITDIAKGTVTRTASNTEGRYTLPNLSVGQYRLEASAPGFKN